MSSPALWTHIHLNKRWIAPWAGHLSFTRLYTHALVMKGRRIWFQRKQDRISLVLEVESLSPEHNVHHLRTKKTQGPLEVPTVKVHPSSTYGLLICFKEGFFAALKLQFIHKNN